MQRCVEPEILDTLPPDHPAALRNRQDIAKFNRLMGNHRWIIRQLRRRARPGDQLIELGAGQGQLLCALHAKLDHEPPLRLAGLDLAPPPLELPPSISWRQADLMALADWDSFDIVVANLILHQFAGHQLQLLGERLASASLRPRLIVVNDLRRQRRYLLLLRLATVLRLHPITRHDARVSIAAGFRGRELPQLLGLRGEQWRIHSSVTMLGSYRLVAQRRRPAHG